MERGRAGSGKYKESERWDGGGGGAGYITARCKVLIETRNWAIELELINELCKNMGNI